MDGAVTDTDLLRDAVDELYSQPMPEFTARRRALAAAAKKAGEKEVAAQIGALRKPTLSADTVNRLVRAAPDKTDELLQLGVSLRAAEKALNGAALRELSGQRRRLVHDLAQLAFDLTDQPSPSASVREEVTSTLNAALADENILDMMMSGALVTQARWDGFGSTSLPELAAVLPLRPADRQRQTQRKADRTEQPDVPATDTTSTTPSTTTTTTRTTTAPAAGRRAPDAATGAAVERAAKSRRIAERQRADRARVEEQKQQHLELAQQESDEADSAAELAQDTVDAIDRKLGELNMQLAHQRKLLDAAQQELRAAQQRRRGARLALTRAGGTH